MRTTITIQEDLLSQAKKLSGCMGYSEAIVTSLKDYVALRTRLSLLENLFTHKNPHSLKAIKKNRKKDQWIAQ
ncbi:MAG: type II toxin-antitoxin system VapB family antitoxin [Deltaproteobacteria bacterium]|nr:type II toxin-antitoxin system VapB family antitoxin [Deltaproteobacteria bacterium]